MGTNSPAHLVVFTVLCLSLDNSYNIRNYPRDLTLTSSKYSMNSPKRPKLCVLMSGPDNQEQKRQEAARLMNDAKLAAEAAEAAAKKAAELKAAFPIKPSAISQLSAPANSETFGVRPSRPLQRDPSLESKFDLAPPERAGSPGLDEDAAFGLSGSTMRTVKSLTWVGIGLLLAIEAWALTQPSSPLMSTPTAAPLEGRSATRPQLQPDAKAPIVDILDGGGRSRPGPSST